MLLEGEHVPEETNTHVEKKKLSIGFGIQERAYKKDRVCIRYMSILKRRT